MNQDAGGEGVVHRIEVPRSARYVSLGGEGDIEAVWVVLHGFGMLARNFIKWFAPAASPTRLVIAPEALSRYYTNHAERKVGATWMTSEDRLAEIQDYVRYLDLVLADVHSRWETAEQPVQVHAFSQGTATACRWVAFGTVRPERLVLWGGGVPPDLDLAQYGGRLNAASPLFVIGDRDEFLSEEVIRKELDRLSAAGLQYQAERFRGGHVVPWPVLERLS